MRTGSPFGRPPIVAQTTGDWLVTPADKARFDLLFDELDKAKKGFISGEDAVVFFGQSNLSEDALAQIWDLADIRSEGFLTRDEFAVAMYLIRQQRTKRDGAAPLPATLPANLVPPSMRTQQARPTPPAASAFEPPPRPQPKPSALDDLFGLDEIQPPAPPQVPVGTGGSAGGDPFASMSPAAPSSPARPSPAASTFKPFVPSSSFGRGLTTQPTGSSNASSTAKFAAAAEDDLLGDTEPEVTRSLTSETTELANLSNQIGSLTKQVQDVQDQRTATQNELNQASTQKKNFEQRLAQLRAMYEKEAQDVRSLETQLTAAKNETKKLQAEYAMVDASAQELQNQHRQVITALQADQQENASLKEKIRVANAEIAQLRPQIEKLKSEARQQKGLVAINKKQLATTEGERERLKADVEDLTKSNEELARQISSSSSPAAQVASPALSTASANNPFFRRTASTDITATFTPPIRSFTDKAFDDVFGPGPAAASSQAGTPPPPAAAAMFNQNTGTSTNSVGSFATPASTSPNVSRQATVVAEPAPLAAATVSFPHFADASESLSTSRQVSPPLSRTETGQDMQSNFTAAPLEPAQTGQSIASGSGSEVRAASPASLAEARAAFPSISEESNKSPAPVKEADPFSVDQDKAKEDFESAFASFKQARAGTASSTDTAKAFTTFSTEFPPISELERDEESDSESEHGGFDDDFAPVSPPTKPAEKAVESRSVSPTVSRPLPDNGVAAAAASPEPAVR
jgi:epidermal growth factor receptor substrate 15